MSLTIGVDVGGTKILAAAVKASGRIGAPVRRTTPGRRVTARLVEDAVVDAVLEAAGDRPLSAVGVSAAGLVDRVGNRVMFAPHLPWQGEPVRDLLSERLGAPVALDNDANCAALAESRFGAGRGAEMLLMITLGTGIGGSVIAGGRLQRGFNGMAGEFGHMRVVPDGLECACGGRGCWEQYVSGTALVRYARELVGTDPTTTMAEACAGDPARLTGPMVTEAAAAGDIAARQAFAMAGEWLGVGLANLVAALDPDRVVVGGGVAVAGEQLLEPARAVVRRTVPGAGHRELPEVLAAALGPEAGLIGAAELARELPRSG